MGVKCPFALNKSTGCGNRCPAPERGGKQGRSSKSCAGKLKLEGYTILGSREWGQGAGAKRNALRDSREGGKKKKISQPVLAVSRN